MKKNPTIIILSLLLTLVPMVSYAGFWDSVRGAFSGKSRTTQLKIDVLVINDQPGAMVEIKGKYKVFDPNTKKHLATRFVGKRKMMQSIATGLKWGEEFPGIYQLHIVPDDYSTPLVVNGIEYKGSIFIYDIGGSVSIVNRVNIEDYLRSTLSSQFNEPIPEETLAAIAIVARSYSLFESQHPKNPYWAVDGQHVNYQGERTIDDTGHVAKAIQTTNNMVLSQTGIYEGIVTPIAAQWGSGTSGQLSHHSAVFSRISLFEAEDLGKNGKDAAFILSKSFPDSHIELIR